MRVTRIIAIEIGVTGMRVTEFRVKGLGGTGMGVT